VCCMGSPHMEGMTEHHPWRGKPWREKHRHVNYGYFAAIFAHESRRVTIRLKTGSPGLESFSSMQK